MMSDPGKDDNAVKKDDKPKTITVFVNNREVELPDKDETGAEVKAAAGVPAEFQLFHEHGKKLEPVPNDEPIKVHNNERFRAVSGQEVA
jgi:hypothetical protein